MTAPAPPSPTQRFALAIEGLYAAVAARIGQPRTMGPLMTGALIVLICARLRRLGARFQALAQKIQAGTLRAWPARARPPRPRATPPDVTRLPVHRLGWLIELVPYHAACWGEAMREVMTSPEVAAMIAATPRMARVLRPLCRMLAITPDFLPPLPPRAPRVRRRVAPVARAAPGSGRAARPGPFRSVKTLGHMEHGTPWYAAFDDRRPRGRAGAPRRPAPA
jgi:hypothetical protein